MKTLKEIFNIIEDKGISISEYEEDNILCGYELNTYTDDGVNEIIFLDFRDENQDPTDLNCFIQEFEDYINSIDIDERIDMNRQDKSYRQNFSIKESVKDFTKWKKGLKKILKNIKKD